MIAATAPAAVRAARKMVDFESESSSTLCAVVIAPSAALRAGVAALLIEGGLDAFGLVGGWNEISQYAARIDLIVAVWTGGQLPDVLDDLPGLPVLLLVEPDDLPVLPLNRLSQRPWGLLALESSREDLLAAAAALTAGLVAGNPALLQQVLSEPQAAYLSGDAPLEALTPREVEVLQRLAEGLTNKQIAYVLSISEHTAKFHISSIYSKLGVMNRAEAVQVGVRYGYIPL